jgi:hypothetical protein
VDDLTLMLPDDGCLIDALTSFMRCNRPELDDILGSACEVYRTEPDGIDRPEAVPALRAYCYFAVRWSRKPLAEIGIHIGVDHSTINRTSRSIGVLRKQNTILADDLDLVAIRIGERVLLNKRIAQLKAAYAASAV